MIVTVTLNPCVDLLLFLDGLKPNDTNRVSRSEEDAGGKGVNVARVARELGAEALATGFLGGGPGAHVAKVLSLQSVQQRFVECQGDTRLNVSVEAGDGLPPTTFNQKGPLISDGEWEELLSVCREVFPGAAWVCLGGSLPPGVPVEAWRILGDIARQAGCRVCLDADGPSMVEGLKTGPDFIKPNLREAERLLDRPLSGVAEAAGAARELLDQLRGLGSAHPRVILSMGADGAVLATPEGTWLANPAPVTTVSTIGSGDSMIGGYLAGLLAGQNDLESLALGAAAGAATASTDGTQIARAPLVRHLLPLVVIEAVGAG